MEGRRLGDRSFQQAAVVLIKDRSQQRVLSGGHGRGTSLPCLGAHGAASKAAWGMWTPSSRSQNKQRSPEHELTSWESHPQSLPGLLWKPALIQGPIDVRPADATENEDTGVILPE